MEWVNLRVTGIGPIPRPEIREIPAGDGDPAVAVLGDRDVFYGDLMPATVYDRAALRTGDEVIGPAVIQEFGSTVPVEPGFRVRVDRFGNLIIVKGPADDRA